MLIRASLFLAVLAGAALALTSLGCSSLTKPDDIQIFAEPPPAPRAAAKAGAPTPIVPTGPARNAPFGRAAPAAPAAQQGCGG